MNMRFRGLALLLAALVSTSVHLDAGQQAATSTTESEFRVLATQRTSTMERELNEAADAGFRFQAVMGGETAVGGKETVAVMARQPGLAAQFQYKLLATNRTSTMQKELQEAADAGYEYRGQTVFNTTFGGKEVVIILERDVEHAEPGVWQYLLLATTKTSTMQKELQETGAQGYELVGLTVADTAMRGKEVVTIMRRRKQ
jgi:hypothetical protein